MELITSLLTHPAFTALANAQVFVAVLLALLVNRIVGPLIDYLNPVIHILNAIGGIWRALFTRTPTKTECYVGKGGDSLPLRPN